MCVHIPILYPMCSDDYLVVHYCDYVVKMYIDIDVILYNGKNLIVTIVLLENAWSWWCSKNAHSQLLEKDKVSLLIATSCVSVL